MTKDLETQFAEILRTDVRPSQALVERVASEASTCAGQLTRKRVRRRRFAFAFAGAAAVLAASVLAILAPSSRAEASLARVQAAIDGASSAHFTYWITGSSPLRKQSDFFYQDGAIRTEMDGITMLSRDGRSWSFDYAHRVVIQSDRPDPMTGWLRSFRVSKMLAQLDQRYQKVTWGDATFQGKPARMATIMNSPDKTRNILYVDPQSNLPLGGYVERLSAKGYVRALDLEISFDRLDRALFDVHIPDGMQVLHPDKDGRIDDPTIDKVLTAIRGGAGTFEVRRIDRNKDGDLFLFTTDSLDWKYGARLELKGDDGTEYLPAYALGSRGGGGGNNGAYTCLAACGKQVRLFWYVPFRKGARPGKLTIRVISNKVYDVTPHSYKMGPTFEAGRATVKLPGVTCAFVPDIYCGLETPSDERETTAGEMQVWAYAALSEWTGPKGQVVRQGDQFTWFARPPGQGYVQSPASFERALAHLQEALPLLKDGQPKANQLFLIARVLKRLGRDAESERSLELAEESYDGHYRERMQRERDGVVQPLW